MGSKYVSCTLSPDLLAGPVPPARTPPRRTVSPPWGPADARLDGGAGRGLGRDGAGCVLRLLLWPQPEALGPVSPQNLAVGQHLFHQDLREAWVGHSREVGDVQPAEVPERRQQGVRPL